jgi:hypothetical protein
MLEVCAVARKSLPSFGFQQFYEQVAPASKRWLGLASTTNNSVMKKISGQWVKPNKTSPPLSASGQGRVICLVQHHA